MQNTNPKTNCIDTNVLSHQFCFFLFSVFFVNFNPNHSLTTVTSYVNFASFICHEIIKKMFTFEYNQKKMNNQHTCKRKRNGYARSCVS